MLKKSFVILLTIVILSPCLLAQPISDQEYINRKKYENNRLQIVTKLRQVNVSSSYGYTDIDTYTYTYEAYAYSDTDVRTSHQTRSEVKEIQEWYVLKGGIRKLNDYEFLLIVGDQAKADWVRDQEESKAGRRNLGTILIGGGIVTMVGGAAMSAGQATITGGALGMVVGFFINAFNLSPDHYIPPDYAKDKIDEYNIGLKRELGLPLNID